MVIRSLEREIGKGVGGIKHYQNCESFLIVGRAKKEKGKKEGRCHFQKEDYYLLGGDIAMSSEWNLFSERNAQDVTGLVGKPPKQ